MIEATFEGTEGKVFYRRWDPEGEPRRIVQFVHGHAEHGRRYAHVAVRPTSHLARSCAGVSYADDPLVYHGQYKRPLLVAEVAALDAFARDIDRLTAPVLLLHRDEDPFVPYERSLQAVRDMASEDVTVRIYDGARHEVLNEINRDRVIADLATWISRVA